MYIVCTECGAKVPMVEKFSGGEYGWMVTPHNCKESTDTSTNKSMPKLPKSYSESEELFLKWWHTGSRNDSLSRKNMTMFYNIIVGNNGS